MTAKDFKLVENSMKYAKVLDLTIEATVDGIFIYSGKAFKESAPCPEK